jgi:hypothetical protein
MQDAFLRLATEVEAEPSNRLPVRQPRAGRGLVASFGYRGSHVVGLDRLLAVPRETIEIAVAERPNLDGE